MNSSVNQHQEDQEHIVVWPPNIIIGHNIIDSVDDIT